MLNEQLDQIHCFSAIFSPPFMAGVRGAADGSFIFRDKNDSEFRGLEHPFVHTFRIAGRSACVPFVQQFLGKLTQTRDIARAASPNLNCWCL